MKKVKLALTLLLELLIVAMGVLIIIYHESFVKVIVICAGISAVLNGISSIRSISIWKLEGFTKKIAIIDGILTILVGLFSVFSPLFVASSAFTTVLIILAINLILSSVVLIELAIVIKRIDKEAKVGKFLTSALINIVVAVILFANPELILATAVKVIGGIVVGLGIGSGVWTIRLYKFDSKQVEVEEVVTEKITEETPSSEN